MSVSGRDCEVLFLLLKNNTQEVFDRDLITFFFSVVNFYDEVIRLKEWGDLWFFFVHIGVCIFDGYTFLKPNALVRILYLEGKQNYKAYEIFKEFSYVGLE